MGRWMINENDNDNDNENTMNKKEETIYKILDIVIEECEVTEDAKITRETMLGKCKRENVCMARCMFVTMLRYMGY